MIRFFYLLVAITHKKCAHILDQTSSPQRKKSVYISFIPALTQTYFNNLNYAEFSPCSPKKKKKK